MNVSLTEKPTFESVQSRISGHQDIMTGAGFPLTGRVALVAEDQERLPGSYRVWLEIRVTHPGDHSSGPEEYTEWVWVNSEGEVITNECPTLCNA